MFKAVLDNIANKTINYVSDFVGEGTNSSHEQSPEDAFNDWLKFGRLHEVLPYESYDEETELYFNKNTIGYVFRGEPLPGAGLKSQEKLNEVLRSKNMLPEGSSMQVMMYASPKIEQQLEWYKSVRTEDPIFAKLAERRCNYLQKKAEYDNSGHIIRDFTCYISVTFPGRIKSRADLENIRRNKDKLAKAFGDIGMFIENLDPKELITDLTGILDFNLQIDSKQKNWNKLDTIAKQVGNGNNTYDVHSDGITITNDTGKYVCRSYVPSYSPEQWSLPQMGMFLGDVFSPTSVIPCPYILHYGIFVNTSQSKENKFITIKQANLEKMSKQKRSRFNPNLSEKLQEFNEAKINIKANDKIITACFSVTLLAKEELIEDCEAELSNVWQNAGWRFENATWDHMPLLLSTMPMTWCLGQNKGKLSNKGVVTGYGKILERLGRAKKTLMSEAQNMLPIVGEWKGQSAPGMPLVGYHGQLFFYNPFDGFLLPGRELSNNSSSYNICISGTMGSGKSVVGEEIVATVRGVGGRVFILDKGESFKNLCISCGGHHINFSVSSKISLNPFTHIPAGDSESEA